jgi:glycosyltransferase involved in cell wall biosynthesis
MYGIPRKKIKLLVMGGEDEKISMANKSVGKNNLRFLNGIDGDDFLIITGGKIDTAKSQTLLLMKAVNECRNKKIKLLIFGSISDKLRKDFESLLAVGRVEFIGWIDADRTYDYFAIADLAVFPGRHSVFWEQAAAQGVPLMVKYWDGISHIDLGGNAIFLYRDNADEIKRKIEALVENDTAYVKMKKAAADSSSKFSYKSIAKHCISI